MAPDTLQPVPNPAAKAAATPAPTLATPAPRRQRLVAAAAALATAAVALIAAAAAPAGAASALIYTLACVAVVVAGWFAPASAAAAFAVLLQIGAANEELRSPLTVVGAIALALIVSLRTAPRVSVVCVAVLWYFIQVDVRGGVLVPLDLNTAVFAALMFASAWAGGTALRATLTTRAKDSAAFQQRLEDERDRAVKALHGSVATSLTSVVLRSEALAMGSSGQTAESAQLIADDARRAMQEVRALIRFMRDDAAENEDMPLDPRAAQAAQNSRAQPATPICGALADLADALRSHGFTVIETGLNDHVLGGVRLNHIESVCRELQTNILKYADAEKPVIVAAVRDEEAVTVAIQNAIADRQRDVHMTTGIGLEDAQELVRLDGAVLRHGYEDDLWRSDLIIPVSPASPTTPTGPAERT